MIKAREYCGRSPEDGAEDEEESVRFRRFPRKCPADEEDGWSWKYHEHDAWYGRHGNGKDERS